MSNATLSSGLRTVPEARSFERLVPRLVINSINIHLLLVVKYFSYFFFQKYLKIHCKRLEMALLKKLKMLLE